MEVNGLDRVYQRINDIMNRFEPKPAPAGAATSARSSEKERSDSPDPLALQSTSGRAFNSTLSGLIEDRARKANVSPDLVRAIVMAESGGDPKAVSSKGARGLMQLMPDTASQLGVNPDSPVENLDGGIQYLKMLAGRFRNLDEVLAAYNAGPGAVEKYKGIPPYSETNQYIKRVRGYLADYKG